MALVLSILVLLLLLPTAKFPETSTSKTNITNVKIALQSGRSLNSFFPMYVAEERGFFKEEGLNVTFIQTGPVASINSLISNNVEFSYPIASAINAKLSGANIKIIMAFSKDDNYFYSNLTSLQELKGKKVGVAVIGGVSYTTFYFLLKNEGINISEINIIVIPDIPQRIQALKSGSVDATISPNTGFKSNETKMSLPLIKYSSSFLGGLITTDKFAEENPEIVMEMARAVARTVKYVYSEKQGTLELLKSGLNVDDKKANELYNFVIENNYYTTKLDLQNLEKEINEIAEASEKSPLPINEFVNSTFVDSLPKELQI